MCCLMEAGLGESFSTAKERCAGPCMHPDEEQKRLSGGRAFRYSYFTDLPYLLVSGLNNRFSVPC